MISIFSPIINFIFYHTPIFYLVQSIWRDEAFSYFMAKPYFIQVVKNTASDFNPPLYYLLLHFWILLVGKSDLYLRLLSFSFHLITTYIAYRFAKRLFSKKFAYFVAVFTFFNPMLLYYAFEMRMYSLYALMTIASFYFLFTKEWKKYLISAVLGLYTHSFFSLIILSYILSYRFFPKVRKGEIVKVCMPFLFFLPWVPVIVIQFLKSRDSWIFPVDIQLVQSVLGNLFINYEGTPGGQWQYTALLSFVLCIFFVYFLMCKLKTALTYLIPIFLPLVFILGYSIVKRPLYVNRYMIFVTVFEILAVSFSIWLLQNRLLKTFFPSIWIVFIIGINLYISPFHKKTDFKSTFVEINNIAKPVDYVYTKTPIAFLESAYYYKNTDRVFAYNPQNITIPYYIGSNVVFPESSRAAFPPSPSRTFLVSDDADFELIVNN